jgi:multidrug resistance efflux pump
MAEENPHDSVLEPNKESVTGPPPPGDPQRVPDSPRRYTPSKGRGNILIVVAARAVLVGGTLLWRYLSSYESAGDAQVEVHLYPNSGRTFRGHVDSIAGATGPLSSLFPPGNATGDYIKIVQRIPGKIGFEPGENRDHQLRPGMDVVPDVNLR